MAIAATMVWEVRTTGNDANGGGFKPGASGTDYSQQDTAQLSLADVVTSSTVATVTSATGGFTSAMVGNLINIAGVITEVTAYTDTNTITVDKVTTTTTGQAGKVGGCLASPGKAFQYLVSSNTCWIKNGTYGLQNSTANTSLSKITMPNGASGITPTKLIGYTTTRGDRVTKTILAGNTLGTAAAYTLLTCGSQNWLENLEFDGLNQFNNTGSVLVGSTGSANVVALVNCRLRRSRGIGFSNAACYAAYCEFDNNVVSGWFGGTSAGITAYKCDFHDNGTLGIDNGGASGVMLTNCKIYNNGASSSHHQVSVSSNAFAVIMNCVIVGKIGAGSGVNTVVRGIICGNIFVNNPVHGVGVGGAANAGVTMLNNAFYGNGAAYDSANITGFVTGNVTLTVDPFVSTAGANFALNETSGGGAAARNISDAFPDTGASFLTLGAVGLACPTVAEVAAAMWTSGNRTLNA